jgi:hexokinase
LVGPQEKRQATSLPSILVCKKRRFEPTLLLTGRSGKKKKGGTNLRVCLVTLQGNGKFEITQSKYRLTEDQKQEEGQKLFDFCAQCLKTFIDTNLGEGTVKDGEKLPLGFTVSS